MDQFKKHFVEKHAAESGPIVQALKPLLTGGQEFQTAAKMPGQEVPNYRFTFSAYDPQTNNFRVKFRNVMGESNGPGEINGAYILIFHDANQSGPTGVYFVGSYDQQTGDLTLNHKDADAEVLHTRSK